MAYCSSESTSLVPLVSRRSRPNEAKALMLTFLIDALHDIDVLSPSRPIRSFIYIYI